MARIKIEDLPVLEDLSAKEIKGIFGGYYMMSSLSKWGAFAEWEAPLEQIRIDANRH